MTLADLRGEVDILQQTLLIGFSTSFPDVPTKREAILMNAYLVLCHGCVEEYLESLFEAHASELANAVTTQPVSPSVAMAAFSWHEMAKAKSFAERTLSDVLQCGSAFVKRAIAVNHGVKEANIINLAKAAGVEWPAFETACNGAMTRLDTLGGKRGSVAHISTSMTMATLNPIYPGDAKVWVGEAIDAVGEIETYLGTTR